MTTSREGFSREGFKPVGLRDHTRQSTEFRAGGYGANYVSPGQDYYQRSKYGADEGQYAAPSSRPNITKTSNVPSPMQTPQTPAQSSPGLLQRGYSTLRDVYTSVYNAASDTLRSYGSIAQGGGVTPSGEKYTIPGTYKRGTQNYDIIRETMEE